MPCDSIATVRAEVGNLAQLISKEEFEITCALYAKRIKYPIVGSGYNVKIGSYDVRLEQGELKVTGYYRPRAQEITVQLSSLLRTSGQFALAKLIAKSAKVNKQEIAQNGALVLEVEL